jgi:hypothetical protein
MFNNPLKTTFVLSPGTARGFDPQPDPPALPEVAFGLVGMTQGLTSRLYVLNAQHPDSLTLPEPVTVEIEFHDDHGNSFLDRTGRPIQKVVTLNPNKVDFLELNGNDIATLGARVGIIPCVKVLRGSPTRSSFQRLKCTSTSRTDAASQQLRQRSAHPCYTGGSVTNDKNH